jgi:large subunit ribosomal protein L4
MSNEKIQVSGPQGGSAGEAELQASWLEREKGEQAVRDTVVWLLAGRRAGTHCAKTKGLVRGGGRKPWRQKGTGRARAGSTRSPLWRGGGIIFPPLPRKYHHKLNRKVRSLALRRAFTERLDEGSIKVVESVALADHKTRSLVQLLGAQGLGSHVLVVVPDHVDRNLALAARNLPTVQALTASEVTVYDMLYFRQILISKGALEALGKRLG